MANKIKTSYKYFQILYESFNPTAGVYTITIGYWQKCDDYDNHDQFKKEVLHTKFYKGKEHYYPTQILCWTSCDGEDARKLRLKKKKPFYSDFQLIIKLNNVKVLTYHKKNIINSLGTFRTNLEIVKKDVEEWLDYLSQLPYAPVFITKKG